MSIMKVFCVSKSYWPDFFDQGLKKQFLNVDDYDNEKKIFCSDGILIIGKSQKVLTLVTYLDNQNYNSLILPASFLLETSQSTVSTGGLLIKNWSKKGERNGSEATPLQTPTLERLEAFFEFIVD